MTFLQHVGTELKKFLHIGETVAIAAEPIIATAFPDVVPIYNSAIGLAISAETSTTNLTGSGPQKLAQALTNIEPLVATWAQKNNISWNQPEIQKWLSAVADTLNMIPAPGTPAPTTATTPAA